VRRILVDDQHFFDKGGPFIEKAAPSSEMGWPRAPHPLKQSSG
jgi:hypothetical protein